MSGITESQIATVARGLKITLSKEQMNVAKSYLESHPNEEIEFAIYQSIDLKSYAQVHSDGQADEDI